VAIGPDLEPRPAPDVVAELIEVTWPNVLVRQESGLLAYQPVKKETPRGTQPLGLAGAPATLTLPTAAPGHFVYVVRDGGGTELNRIAFEVVGEGNVAGRAERNAELGVRLAKADYAPGEEIEVAIVAPYAGAGLLTIERDRVYAARWFKSDGNATVQTIRVPEGLEGNGYVVVSFVRDLASRDVFLSPLSSGAAPFAVSRARRTQALALEVPDHALPGSRLHIGWTAPEATRLAVLAVDEGILQVARWRTPDPLAHFFRKRALAVTTSQILDLLLPEYDVVRTLAAPGGDQDMNLAGNLNPFKRKGQKPTAFWSGVLDVPAGPGGVDYDVPDVFNGSLRVVAVAVNARAIGVAVETTVVRGPFVVQPTLPYFAAPGDTFEATALVTNVLEGSGSATTVKVTLETSPGLEVDGPGEQTLTIAEGRDATARWKLRVTGRPGTARGTFRATSGEHTASATLEMSVRPAAPFVTTVVTHSAGAGGQRELAVDRKLFAEEREVVAAAATSPLGLVPGLADYLASYPHGCTEQVVSAAMPGLILGARPDLGVAPERARVLFERARATLQARQNGDGAFGLWDADAHTDDFLTAYATHFLIEARAHGQAVPEGMVRRALDYLAANLDETSELPELRARSYGVYLLTRSGQVKTKEARTLRDALVRLPAAQWKGDLAALFLAATFQQLSLGDEARPLLDGVSLTRNVQDDWAHHYDALVERGFGLYLLARHFPERAQKIPAEALVALADEVARFNTFSAGALVLGLDAAATLVPPVTAGGVEIAADGRDGAFHPLAAEGTTVLRAAVPEDAGLVRFTGPAGRPLFHQLVQAGFDREPPAEKAAQGLEVSRELRAADGAVASKTSITGKLDVVLLVRATDARPRDVAVIDLLPGGFEVDLTSDGLATRRSLVGGPNTWTPAYVDVREDRVVLYGWVDDRAQRFVYRIKPTNRGHFRVPPVLIEGFYDRLAWGRGLGGAIDVGD
jgi:alpha-2-macroglobulin